MSADQTIAELARGQHAVFTGGQAVERQVSRRQLQHRVEIGQLTRIDHDVFHIAGAPLSWESRVLGFVLAAGPHAVASHRCAAALWGFEGFGRGTPEITVPRGQRFRRTSARVHESTDLDRCGRRLRAGIPVTDPSRTLLDLARRLGDDRLWRAIESARRQQLTTWSELIAVLAKHARRGRPGIQRLRRVIAANAHREEITDSDFEMLVLALLLEHGLPEPVIHHVLRTPRGRHLAEIDLAYPWLRIAIELDGGDHQRRDVFERDRPRQNGIVLEGWVVLRFTWDTYAHRPHEIVEAVRAAVALRSSTTPSTLGGGLAGYS
ncbi:MAG: DUF559 domain-containing protein [Acidimicrobiales bacterium]